VKSANKKLKEMEKSDPETNKISYDFRIDDYGGGKFQFVCIKNGVETFHSNGYETKEKAEQTAKDYIQGEKYQEENGNKK